MYDKIYPNAHTEGKGTINLCARVLFNGAYIETHILDANAITQTAEVRIPGRHNLTLPFSKIANVALKFANGAVIENFGAPRVNQPESIAYAVGWKDAQV